MKRSRHVRDALADRLLRDQFTVSCPDAIVSLSIDAVGLVGQQVSLIEEFVGPGSALLGLNSVLVTDFDQQFTLVQQCG